MSIYPNPCSDKAIISYSIGQNSHVRIEILNMVGERLATLVEETQGAGEYRIELQPEKYRMIRGIYFVRVSVEEAGIFTYKLIRN